MEQEKEKKSTFFCYLIWLQPKRIKQYKRPTFLPPPPTFGSKRYIIASFHDVRFKFK
jgi:hypothetical protein